MRYGCPVDAPNRNHNNKQRKKIMKKILSILASLALATSLLQAKDLINCDAANKIALQGYDPVAFFTDGNATKGSPFITGEHKGATYLFASEEHKAIFAKDPEKYVPAYGGYCAFGVSVNKLFPIKIETWEIVDGQLVLQYSKDVK